MLSVFVPQAQLASERGANADVLTAAEELQDAIRNVQDAQASQQKWSTAVNEVRDPASSLPSNPASLHPQGVVAGGALMTGVRVRASAGAAQLKSAVKLHRRLLFC